MTLPKGPEKKPSEQLMSVAPPRIERSMVRQSSSAERREIKPTTDKYENIPDLTKEKLQFARTAIDKALEKLKTPNPKMKKAMERYGINFNSTDHYLSIGIKESKLNPLDVSGSNAKGMFQILFNDSNESEVLEDVERIYGVKLNHDDVFYDGIDPEKQAAATANNAYAFILYWHLCRDYYRQKNGLSIRTVDQDKASAFAYNMGPGAFSTLWKELKPKNFRDFIIKIGEKLEKEFPQKVNMPKGKTGLIPDVNYAVKYWPGFYLNEEFAPEDSIQVGHRHIKGRKIMESKRYAEVIYSLWHEPTLTPAELQKLSAKAPQTKAIEHIKGRDYETIEPPNRWMWGIATSLLQRAQNEHAIPYFNDPDLSVTTKTRTLITILVNYNKTELKAPGFDDIEEEDKDPNVPAGTKVFFPSKAYIELSLKKMNSREPAVASDSGNEKPVGKAEVLPTNVPLYSGPQAAKLSKMGKEIISYRGAQPPCKLKIPERKGEPLDPNQPSTHGIMGQNDVKYIILHATEGSGVGLEEKLYRTQNIHYLVRLDGTVELIRNEWINPNEKDPKKKKAQKRVALDHAGLWRNKSRKETKKRRNSKGKMVDVTIYKGGQMALWSGDEDISKHTVGIEVETTIGGTYNEAQYKALKPLVAWIGSRYKIPKSNVLAHSQMAVVDLLKWWSPKLPKRDRWQRGRKQDPRNLNWGKLGLPNNYYRVDPDVANGTIGSHLKTIKAAIAGAGGEGWGLNASVSMLPGLEAADKIWQAKVAAAKKAKKLEEERRRRAAGR